MTRPAALVAAAALGALLSPLFTACASAPPPPDKPAAKAEDKKSDPRIKAREIEQARLELQSAEIDSRSKGLASEEAVQKAARELELAQAAMKAFETVDAPSQLDGAQINHDRQAYAADEARDELNELEQMYQAEEFAKTTKELVLKRGRRRLEVAQRELAVSKQKLALLKDHALPRQKNELAGKVHDAEVVLQKAKLDAEKSGIDVDVALRKARAKIEDLQQELAEANAKADKTAKSGS